MLGQCSVHQSIVCQAVPVLYSAGLCGAVCQYMGAIAALKQVYRQSWAAALPVNDDCSVELLVI